MVRRYVKNQSHEGWILRLIIVVRYDLCCRTGQRSEAECVVPRQCVGLCEATPEGGIGLTCGQKGGFVRGLVGSRVE